MLNKSKTLTSLAAASMVITQAGQLHVFANEANYDLNNVSKDNEVVGVRKTQKEQLEDQILIAQKKLDQVQSDFKKEEKILDEFKQNLDLAKNTKVNNTTHFNTINQTTNTYINNEIKVNADAIKEAQEELDALKAEKERLEKESSDSEAQKAQLEKDYQNAQNKYNELISQGTIEDLTEQIVSQQKAVESANASLQNAQAKYDAVKGRFDEVSTNIKDLETQVTAQQSKVESLNAQLSAETAAMQEASANLNNIQQAYDAATDEAAKAELEGQLASAQASLTSATEAYEAVNAELGNEKNILSSLESNLNAVKAENQNAIDAFNEAQNVLNQAQQSKTAADAELATLQQSLVNIKEEIKKVETDVSTKKGLLDALAKDTAELAKLVESTRMAYDAVQMQWNQGSLGFYESIGDTQGVEVIKEGIALGTTKLGDIGDATDLTNMKKAIPLLAECNRLRIANGKTELKTSGLLMAIAQVNNNHSVFREGEYDSPHTELYNTGENLASGFGWD